MMQVQRFPSLGYTTSSDRLDILEMSSRLMDVSLDSIHEELKDEFECSSSKDESPKNANGAGAIQIPPRRAFTTSDYLLPTAPVSRVSTPPISPRETCIDRDSYFQLSSSVITSPSRSPYLSPLLPKTMPARVASSTVPPRSYSVMDYEPIPFTHQPGTTLQLAHLPPELHYAIYDFLDPIDSVCLALTSRHFYAVHRQMQGNRKISLAARREGPNDMEWVWRHAGPFLLNRNGVGKQNSLAMLSPRGQVYCRKCRTARCELHKHIKEWMGEGVEYCLVTEKFGAPAPEGAKGFCYRSSPRHPNRCGRHTRNQRPVRLV